MYKVMLVDDEIWVTKNLKSIVDWNKYNMEIVAEASDGIEAANFATTIRPDVLITDLRMPGIDGLELIKKYSEINPDSICIIVSGYNEFPYVQKALRLEAFDYILKPIDASAIERLLLRVSAKLHENCVKTRTISNDPSKNCDDQNLISIKTNINEIKSYIDDYYQKDLSLSIIAEQFHISSSYLSDIFSRTVGCTFIKYITNVRIEKAKQLLLYTDYAVETIAIRVGYKDYRQFVRAFKRVCDLTPTQFRETGGSDIIYV